MTNDRQVVVTLAVMFFGLPAAIGFVVYAHDHWPEKPPTPRCTTAWCQCFDDVVTREWNASINRSMALNQAAIQALVQDRMAEAARLDAQEKAEDAWQSGDGIGLKAAEQCRGVSNK
jgi:hypothetical protein